MVAGLKITGSSGAVQIDENYKNLVLREKRVVAFQESTAGGDPGGENGTCVAIVDYPNPIVAVRDPGGAPIYMVRRFMHEDGRWRFRFWSPVASGYQFTLYIYDECPNHMSNGGLLVKNAAGQTIYSSDYAPLNIAAVAIGSYTGDGPGGASTFVVPIAEPGRIYAVIHGLTGRKLRYGINILGGGPGQINEHWAEYDMGCLSNVPEGVKHELKRFKEYFKYNEEIEDSRNVTLRNYSILVADVTNL